VIGDSECGDEYDFVEHSEVRERLILFQLNHIAAEDCEDIVLYFVIVVLQLSFTLKDAQSLKFLLQCFIEVREEFFELSVFFVLNPFQLSSCWF
jgi:hypothetical protein